MAARSRRDLRNPPDHFGSKRRETSNAAARPQPPPRVLDRQLPQEQPSRVKVRLARRGYNTAAAPALAVLVAISRSFGWSLDCSRPVTSSHNRAMSTSLHGAYIPEAA